MVSPLQARRQQLSALKAQPAQAQAQDGDCVAPLGAAPKGGYWDVIRACIKKDKQALKGIKAVAEKVEYKRRNLSQYTEALARADMPADIATALMVWLFDSGDMPGAMQLGMHCAAQNLPMPEGFKSSVRDFIADAVLEWSKAQYESGYSPSPWFDELLIKVQSEWDSFDAVVGGYLKLAGLMQLGPIGQSIKHATSPQTLISALELLEKARRRYPRVGVDTRIKEIEKRLSQLVPASV